MSKGFVQTNDAPHVILEIHGNLQLKGTDDFEVSAKSDASEDLALEGGGEEARVRGYSDTTVRVPRQATVDVEIVNGNAEIKALEGELSIREVDGNLDLRSVGPTRLELLRGNLTAKHIDGDLNVKAVDGNIVARDVTGSFMVGEQIRGNLNLDDVTENVVVKADGNLVLRFDPSPGQKYQFTSGGNILCRLPDDASAKVRVERGDNIIVKVGEVQVSEQEKVPFEVTLGEGDAELIFSAGGNVTISGQAPNWEMGDFDFELGDFELGGEFENMAEQISQQVTQQIEAQVDMIEQQINAQMENLATNLGNVGLSPEQAERIAQRAKEASARATARAQERMQHAQEKIQRKMEAAQRKAEQKARAFERRSQKAERRSWSFEWPSPPVSPARPARPVPPETPLESASDEERLLILRMLEQKKITAEEAEQLLAALEGKGG